MKRSLELGVPGYERALARLFAGPEFPPPCRKEET
jgi:hypothetical protein